MAHTKSNSLSSRNNPPTNPMSREDNTHPSLPAMNLTEKLLQQLMHKINQMQEEIDTQLAKNIPRRTFPIEERSSQSGLAGGGMAPQSGQGIRASSKSTIMLSYPHNWEPLAVLMSYRLLARPYRLEQRCKNGWASRLINFSMTKAMMTSAWKCAKGDESVTLSCRNSDGFFIEKF